MNRNGDSEAPGPNDERDAVPFTARLNAFYRATEYKSAAPLLSDPYAERLAGDMAEYFDEHKRFREMGGSQIARSHYIENDLLKPWCEAHENSQIVLLGAGLDTRAYRLSFLQSGSHAVFELDLPAIIDYKEQVLRDEHPVCSLTRISTDLTKPDWMIGFRNHGLSNEVSTFWILEGLVYYLDKTVVHSLIRVLSEVSTDDSQLFLDVCVPALADLRWGPFTDHFKWGIAMDDIPEFFATGGWSVSSSYLDDYSHGRDVGQKGLILVRGTRNLSGLGSMPQASATAVQELTSPEMKQFSRDLMIRIIPEIEGILDLYIKDPERGLSEYISFLKRTQQDLQTIALSQKNPTLLGKISPRLLGDPLSIETDARSWSDEETESYITAYLTASLQLVYCGMKELNVDQYHSIPLHKEFKHASASKRMELLHRLLSIMKREVQL
jgi:methyltransferase (TIGR00027 family)